MKKCFLLIFALLCINCTRDSLVDPNLEETKQETPVVEEPPVIEDEETIEKMPVIREMTSHGSRHAHDLFEFFENQKKYIYIHINIISQIPSYFFGNNDEKEELTKWHGLKKQPVQIVVDPFYEYHTPSLKRWVFVDKNGKSVMDIAASDISELGKWVDFTFKIRADSLGMNDNPLVLDDQSVYGLYFTTMDSPYDWAINHTTFSGKEVIKLNLSFYPEELKKLTIYYGTNPENINDVLWTNEVEFLYQDDFNINHFKIYISKLTGKLKPETVYFYQAKTNDNKYKSHIYSFKYSPQLFNDMSYKYVNGAVVGYNGGNRCYLISPYNGAIGVSVGGENVLISLILHMYSLDINTKRTGNIYWGTDSVAVENFSSMSKKVTVSFSYQEFIRLPIWSYGEKIYWRAEFCDKTYITPVFHFTTKLSPGDPNAMDYR